MVASITATITTNLILPSAVVNALLQIIALVLLIFAGNKKDIENKIHYNIQIAGFAVTLLPVAVFQGFGPVCYAYDNCFKGCPFPLDFNLSIVVFHVIFLARVTILGWSEIVSRSSAFLEDVPSDDFDAKDIES